MARIPIVSEFKPQGIDKAIKEFKKLETTGQKIGFGLKKAFLPAAAALAGVGAASVSLVNAGERAATANARIEQINKSMGLFGESTQAVTDRLVKLAEATARQTGIDQNSIKATQAKLLTFGEVAKTADEVGGAFDRATTLALDLAAAGFGAAETNAVQLGKALQDPIKGITALAKSGVTFTDEQKAMIEALVESGQTLEAQEVILKAIEDQVGGTANATANATDKMKVGFSQLTEQIGMALLPAVEAILPIFMNLVQFAADNTDVIITLGAMIGALAGFIVAANVAMAAWNAIGTITKVVNAALGQSFSALWVATGVGIVIVLIGAIVLLQAKFNILGKAVDGVSWYFTKWWATVKWVFNKVIDGINFLIRAWNKLPLVPDIEEITWKFDQMAESTHDASDTMRRDHEATKKKIIENELAYDDLKLSLQEYAREGEKAAKVTTPKVTKGFEGLRGAISQADLKLRGLYDDLTREESVAKFEGLMQDLKDAVGTDGFEKALRDAKLGVFDLADNVGGLSAALQQELIFAIDTGDAEWLDTLILSIKENWSAFSGTRFTSWENAQFTSLDPFNEAILNMDPALSAALGNRSASKGGTMNVTVNMPAGSNGDDVVRALQETQRRKGALPFAVNGARR